MATKDDDLTKKKEKIRIIERIKDDGMDKYTKHNNASRSSTKLVRDLVGRKACGEGLNKSTSEMSSFAKPNKPLVALGSTSNLPPKTQTVKHSNDKKAKHAELDAFLKLNYGAK